MEEIGDMEESMRRLHSDLRHALQMFSSHTRIPSRFKVPAMVGALTKVIAEVQDAEITYNNWINKYGEFNRYLD